MLTNSPLLTQIFILGNMLKNIQVKKEKKKTCYFKKPTITVANKEFLIYFLI